MSMRSSAMALLVAFGFAPAAAFAQQVSDDVVRIGVLTDMTGPYADFAGPGSVVAARMAVEDHGGRVLGRPVEVVVADHQNKPDVGGATARRWIDTDRVDMIIDMPNSAVALALNYRLGEAKLVNPAFDNTHHPLHGVFINLCLRSFNRFKNNMSAAL
mgnify:CR=1 FL=1